MKSTETSIATDSAAELHNLIGDDATATFESDPKFVDSNPTESASSGNIEVQRDTDDTEDSDEEDDEIEDADEEEEEEDEEDEDDDEDDDDEEEDDDEEVGAAPVGASAAVRRNHAVDSALDLEEAGLEEVDDASDARAAKNDHKREGEGRNDVDAQADRAIDASLRLSALVKVAAEFVASF